MWFTSVDLPEPDTPVTAISVPSGNDTSIPCRLFSRAPTTVTCRYLSIGRRTCGIGMLRRPDRYAPVTDSADASRPVEVAGVHDATAVLPRARTDVDDPVGHPDGVLVVLDDDQRVAQVAQPGERLDQPAVVALVQPDRRLVEDVQHADQAGPDLRGQPDALRLAARTACRPGA